MHFFAARDARVAGHRLTRSSLLLWRHVRGGDGTPPPAADEETIVIRARVCVD